MGRAQINGKPAVIKQIEQQTGDNDKNFVPFSVDDKNVQIYTTINNEDSPWGTLRHFFQEWKNFKDIWKNFIDNAYHIIQSETEPISSKIIVWYDTSSDEENQNANG